MSVFSQLMMRKKSGFKILDFIQSHGKQYIDTGFIPNQDTKIEMVCEVLSNINSPYLFGAGQGWENKAFALAFNNSSSIGLIFCYGQYTSKRTGSNFQINYKYKITFSKSYLEVYNYATSSVTYSQSNPYNAQTFSAGANALIFATSWNTSSETAEQMKLYSLKIWDNGTLARDFVPVLNEATGERGVLDNVENKFYGNSGTGEFLGSDQMILTTVGSPTITDGVVSGFSGSNYIENNNSFDITSNFEINIKINYWQKIDAIQYFMSLRGNKNLNLSFVPSATTIRGYNGTVYWDNIATDLTIGVPLEFTIKGDGTNLTAIVKQGAYINTTSKAISELELSGSFIVHFGKGGATVPFTSGEIDFNNSYEIRNGTKYNYVIA